MSQSDTATAEQGAPQTGQPSGAATGQTSTPRTYSEEEYQAALNRVSNKMAEQGRKHKEEMGQLQGQISDGQARLTALQDELDKVLEEGVKAPDAKEVIKLQREIRRERAKLTEDRAALQRERESMSTEKQELSQFKLLRKATTIAKDYEGVDPQALVDLTDGTEEKMEALAKVLGKPKQAAPAPKGGTTPISETGAGGMSDDAFWSWAAEPGRNLSGADMKRLKAIRDKRMNGG